MDPENQVTEPTVSAPATTPAPPPDVTQTPPPDDGPSLEDAFEQLDQEIVATTKKPDTKPEDAPKDESTTKKVESQPTEDDLKKLPRDFRKRLEQVNAELSQAKERETKLQNELKSYQESKGLDAKALQSDLEKRAKELNELRGELRKVRFEKSDDYVQKYEKPFTDLRDQAFDEVTKLKVTVEGPDGEPTKRDATYDDFVKLYHLPLAQQDEAVDAMFGKSAYRVNHFLVELRNRERAMQSALDSEKKDWETRSASERAESIRMETQINELWRKANADFVSKRPEWYAPKEGDEEGNKLLQKGYELFEPYWTNRANMKREDILIFEAQLRNRAAALPRMAHENALMKAKVEELESKIQKLLGKGPGRELRGVNEDATADLEAKLAPILESAFEN